MARTNESRQRILDAAERVFARKGYFASSTDEIAREADVAKGTLYYNFKSKGEIFETLVAEGLNHLNREIESALSNEVSVKSHLSDLVQIHVRFATDFPDFTRILLSEMSSGLDDGVQVRVEAIRGRYIQRLASLLAEAQGMGAVMEGDPLFLAEVLAGLLISVGGGTMPMTPKRTQILSEFILEGLARS
ncbi:MAG: TetR/AcrR family transcriptional regulator [Spirochaetales bacterium]|nr:TetR/AcrR family transcriptional regulator [Spirochaetales bacterium]